MIKAQQSWVKHHDMPKYKEGNLVWFEGKNLQINQPTPKLAPRRHGPFKVIQVMSTVNYRLELPTQWSIHPVFHIDLLTPYKETIMHGPNFTQPTPELINGEEEYSVEKILDSQHFGRRKRLQYLVKWEDTQTRIICGSIRMTCLLMTRFGNSNFPTPTQKHI
jgi:hypothetical protein